MRGRIGHTLAVASGLLVLLGAMGCGDGKGDGDDARKDEATPTTEAAGRSGGSADGEATTTTAPPETTAPPTTAAPTDPSRATAGGAEGGEGDGCPANGGRVPPNAALATTVDLDRDGERDQVWFSVRAGQQVGVSTASGLVVARTARTAKPIDGITVLDVDQRGPVELIASDGATAHMYAFQGCEIRPIIGPDDRQYLFDLSFERPGSGVQCRDIDGDGRRELLGVFFADKGNGTATVEQTVVELDGIAARNGDTSERTVRIEAGDTDPGGPYEGLNCGDATITAAMIDESSAG
jgi:hypothetical protein